MPSSTAARVACSASSTRSFFSLTSTSVAPHLDHRDAPGQLGQALLQLLAIIVGGGVLDLCLDLADPALDPLLVARAVDDRGLLFGDDHPLGAAEHVDGDVLELDPEVLADQLTAGQNRDVLEHRLAAIAEARRLDRRNLQPAAQLVDHERGQRFALDVLSDDQERLARLHDLLEHRQQRLQAGELLLVQQDVRLLELDRHLLGVGDEVRREVAPVELHALDHLELGGQALGFLDRDHAFLADLLHRLGDHLADAGIAEPGARALLGPRLQRPALRRGRSCP